MRYLILILLINIHIPSIGQTKYFEPINQIHTNWKKTNSKYKMNCNFFFYADTIDTTTIEITENVFFTDSVFIKWTPKQDTTNKDRITLTLKERKFIQGRIRGINLKPWNDKLFTDSRVIPFDKIDDLIKTVNDKKEDPLKRLCSTVYFFTRPIFLRRNSLCIFYFGKTTFATKEGEFWIYEKKNTK